MITIQKGNMTREVSRSAFKSIYSLNGWVEVKIEPSKDASQEPAVAPERSSDSSDSDNTPEDENASEELLGSKISNMSNKELKQYASLLGIDTQNKSPEQLRKMILEVEGGK